jgi:hypothetical protein
MNDTREMAEIPRWYLRGDWFDACNCLVPCPCTFAQAPTYSHCEGVLVYHVREGRFGDLALDGLNVVALGAFDGNVWAEGTSVTLGMIFDARADDRQRQALQVIFSGQAGGWPAVFARNVGEIRGVEVAPIEVEVAADLSGWRVSVPGKVAARAEALSGPTSVPGKPTQTINPPGAEMGPGSVATWAVAVENRGEALGFEFDLAGKSSKHMAFDWSGPDQ